MQDEIIKFLAYNGKISVVCINSTEMVEKARKIHDLSPVTTAAFGRMLTAPTFFAIFIIYGVVTNVTTNARINAIAISPHIMFPPIFISYYFFLFLLPS